MPTQEEIEISKDVIDQMTGGQHQSGLHSRDYQENLNEEKRLKQIGGLLSAIEDEKKKQLNIAIENSVYWFKRYNSLVDKLSDQIFEFGDNPKDCLAIIEETIQAYWLHDNKKDTQPIQEVNNDVPTNKS